MTFKKWIGFEKLKIKPSEDNRIQDGLRWKLFYWEVDRYLDGLSEQKKESLKKEWKKINNLDPLPKIEPKGSMSDLWLEVYDPSEPETNLSGDYRKSLIDSGKHEDAEYILRALKRKRNHLEKEDINLPLVKKMSQLIIALKKVFSNKN